MQAGLNQNNEELVVLTDEYGSDCGLMPKMEAHRKGLLHKAISVMLYNSAGETLIQQRADNKYHWPGIWSNTCCSHPRSGESFSDAAHRRLREELNIEVPLTEQLTFIYKATDPQTGLTEYEYDKVFRGQFDGPVHFNPEEVKSVKWISISALKKEMAQHPEQFSFWFGIILDKLERQA